MLSRTLISAAVALLIGCFAAPAGAQNLEAGKTPSQIFSGTCSLCHKSSRGILKTIPPGSLPGFLRQHYTTSSDMAALLSAYVLSNGAADTRLGGDNLTKQGKEAKTETKPNVSASADPRPKPEPKPERRTHEASRPDVEGLENVPGVAEQPAANPNEAAPVETKQKGKKAKLDKKKPPTATAKDEPNVEPSAAPSPGGKIEPEKTEVAKSDPQTRTDPVPPVTPAPGTSDAPQKIAEEKSSNMPVFNIEPAPPAAVAPPEPPRTPAGPPVVPISQ